MWLEVYRIKNEYIKTFSIVVFKKTIFSYQNSEYNGFFRIFEKGISWRKTPPMNGKHGPKKSLKIKEYYITLS